MSRWFDAYGHSSVSENLRIGAYPLDASDVEELVAEGVERVLSLVEDAEYPEGARDEVLRAYVAAGIEERQLSSEDFGRLDDALLEDACAVVNAWLTEDRSVYLHCRAGWQRSASVAAGVLAIRLGLEIDDAVDLVRLRRPSADPLPHQREDLRRWWAVRQR